MAEIFVEDLTLTYPLLGSGVRKKIKSPWTSGAGPVERDKEDKSRGVLALKNISLHLQDGDRLGIVGPNGAGKSTLLRVLAGIYEPNIGHVSVDGEIATLFNIGLGLQAEATGYRNILLSGLISGKTRQEIMARLPEIEEFSELGEYLKLPVRTYSNGMAMRLKFAAATTFQPNILLMDEWLGAGDKKFTLKARQRMQEIVSSAGILVLASHRQRLIQNECNKILWLDSGEMKAFGAVDDILPEFLESMEPIGQKTTHTVSIADEIEETPQGSKATQAMPIPDGPIKANTLEVETESTAKVDPVRKKKRGGKKKRAANKKARDTKKTAGKSPLEVKPVRKKKRGGKKKANASQKQTNPKAKQKNAVKSPKAKTTKKNLTVKGSPVTKTLKVKPNAKVSPVRKKKPAAIKKPGTTKKITAKAKADINQKRATPKSRQKNAVKNPKAKTTKKNLIVEPTKPKRKKRASGTKDVSRSLKPKAKTPKVGTKNPKKKTPAKRKKTVN